MQRDSRLPPLNAQILRQPPLPPLPRDLVCGSRVSHGMQRDIVFPCSFACWWRSLWRGVTLVAQQRPPVFRTGVVSIPVDVRVLDRDGKAVTDLTAADFTLLENGVPQEIRYFSAQALTAAAPDASVRRAASRTRRRRWRRRTGGSS